ncbi:hypothetical protein PoB_001398800 [Plakobranchus ocellatus]|uniref:Uncharacterized protein n=1 Tax=Plakobranchus ocellatus TaxID=259542 RepID=A0AAV3YYA0_9GAST|nr:hypothetical protein PoB_001398800 [Plakobranchus ocellatus]
MANLAVGTEVFDEYCTSTNSTFVAKCAKTVESHNKRILLAKGKYPVEWQYVSITFECKHFGTYKITKASPLEKGKCKSRKREEDGEDEEQEGEEEKIKKGKRRRRRNLKEEEEEEDEEPKNNN